jgi:hypothetical protein
MKTTDGPASPHFTPVQWQIESAGDLSQVSEAMQKLFAKAPQGEHVTWGIPFSITKPIVLSDRPVEIPIRPLKARWLVFLHTSDMRPMETNPSGFISPMHGEGMLNEHAATYSAAVCRTARKYRPKFAAATRSECTITAGVSALFSERPSAQTEPQAPASRAALHLPLLGIDADPHRL